MKFFRKQTLWIPTWKGLLLISLLLGGLFSGGVLHLYPFLAQHHPRPDAEWIAIEGWLADSELQEAVRDLRPGQIVVTTGGPVFFCGSLLENKTYAELTVDRLLLLGVPPEQILCASAPDAPSDRTYNSATAVRILLEQRGLFGKPCNIYSIGVHSRRTFQMYRLAFGADYPLGIVSLKCQDCDQRCWWRSSLAFKSVLTEFISWFYTLFAPCKYA
ncbi:MAG: YdcF family protein [Pontiellaceae bacterium]|jgi:hypothetical protein|nr:YdcF family protein [Pontiellaceae bacterium]